MCLLDRWKDSTDLPLETDWDGALVGYLGSLARRRCCGFSFYWLARDFVTRCKHSLTDDSCVHVFKQLIVKILDLFNALHCNGSSNCFN